ncbi:MAG TPA: YfiR family protein [Rhodanobacteraceae bacterium]|nr:YfiR family protein [Rhodanobacteraceae bacterium]
MAECALLMVLMLTGAESFAQSPAPKVSLEYAVKATYLYKMAPFVNWPPHTFTSPDAPFEICVLGRDPFQGFLERQVAGRGLGSHPFKVRQLDGTTSGADCQIVFIGYSGPGEIREALRAFDGKPVLTVTDSGAVDSSGSIVQFVMDSGHVRFEVDNAAAERNHLEISSKLLSLALAVKGSG